MKGHHPILNRLALQQHRSRHSSPSLSSSSSSSSSENSASWAMVPKPDGHVRSTALRLYGSRAGSTSSSSSTLSWNASSKAEVQASLHYTEQKQQPQQHAIDSESSNQNSTLLHHHQGAHSIFVWNNKYYKTVPILLPDVLFGMLIGGLSNYLQGWMQWLDKKLPLFLQLIPSSLWWPNLVRNLFIYEEDWDNQPLVLTSSQDYAVAVTRNHHSSEENVIHRRVDDDDDDNMVHDNGNHKIISRYQVNAIEEEETDFDAAMDEWGHFAYFTEEND